MAIFGRGLNRTAARCPHNHRPVCPAGPRGEFEVVAAVLTIAGYSINDTVVVFDRIREEMRLSSDEPLLPILKSLAQPHPFPNVNDISNNAAGPVDVVLVCRC